MADTPKRVDIPAGELSVALLKFSKQYGAELVYRPEQVYGLKTHGAHGRFTTEQAVTQLLQGTPLELHTDLSGAMLIAPPTPGSTQAADSATQVSGAPSQDTSDDSKEGKKNSSQDFRLAQMDQGAAPSDVALNASERAVQPASQQLDELVVTGRYQFLSADTSGTTNLPLPIEQVPQSISLVSGDFIAAADLKTLGEIAEYTPGAVNAGNPLNQGTVIKLRGFAAGRSIDGINTISSQTFYEADNAIYDRLEIVKGPSSVVYGVSSPGGLVNYVTKSATAQTPNYLLAQVGSWNSFRLEGQVARSLDSEGHVRAIGLAVEDQGDSFMHEMYHKRTTLYGGLNADLGSSVTTYLHGGFERYEAPAFDGYVTEPDGSPPPLSRAFFTGSRAIGTTTDIYHTEGDLTWHATDVLDFSVKGNYQTIKVGGAQTYAFGLGTQPGGNPRDLGIYVNTLDAHVTNYGMGVSSIYRLDNWGLKNSFVSVAALYQNSDDTDNYSYPPDTAVVNLSQSESAISQAFNALLAGPLPVLYDREIKVDTLTISGQSILQIMDPLAVLVGVSYSKPTESEAVNGTLHDAHIEGQTSYRVGLTYEVLPKTYAYLSYSQSFNPQISIAADQSLLPPTTGEQYEAGIKYRDEGGHLLLTGAVFKIKQKDVSRYDTTIDFIDYFAAVGEVTHQGAELQAIGQITREWQINAGYTYLDPKITEASAANSGQIGQTELYLPKQTFSLYTTYTLRDGRLRGLSFGGGARYVSDERTAYHSALANLQQGLSATKALPSYTLVDVNVGYTIDKWLIQLNAHNLLDRHYFINNFQTLFYGNATGDPNNVALSVRWQF